MSETAKQEPGWRDPTKWHFTGFGGSLWDGPFERMAGTAHAMKNGTQLDLWIAFPGEETSRRIQFNQTELRSLLASGSGAFLGHGLRRDLRVETDVTGEVREQMLERVYGKMPDRATIMQEIVNSFRPGYGEGDVPQEPSPPKEGS